MHLLMDRCLVIVPQNLAGLAGARLHRPGSLEPGTSGIGLARQRPAAVSVHKWQRGLITL